MKPPCPNEYRSSPLRPHRPGIKLCRAFQWPRCHLARVLCGLWLALLGTACVEAGDIFLWRDERGQAHYSDRPAQGAQRLKVAPPAPVAPSADLRVARVYDGDTIQMENGEKVRLLGINTPELGRRDRKPEPGAEEAKAWLAGKLAGRRVRLEQDTTARDKYQRRLAHVFLADGTHINLDLLRQGLATTDIYPPDLKYVDALVAAESDAEKAKRGLWAMREYRPKPADALQDQQVSGWQRLVGTPVEASRGKRYARLRFLRTLEIRVPNEDLHLFPPLERYLGHPVEVRGWVSHRGAWYAVTVRHPSALVQR